VAAHGEKQATIAEYVRRDFRRSSMTPGFDHLRTRVAMLVWLNDAHGAMLGICEDAEGVACARRMPRRCRARDHAAAKSDISDEPAQHMGVVHT
jgi:hypothetical protein